jgi:glycosyltransferase involved in cell wall biosynthesis
MRILHTIPGRNWGGMEHRTIEQVRWLVAHDHPVWLAAPADGEPFARAQALGLPVIAFNFDRPWRLPTMTALRAIVRQHRVDIIDTHVTRDAKAAMGCMDLCAVVRSRHVNQPLKPSLVRRLQWRMGADHIITVAQCTRDHLRDIGLADPARSTAIGGWADEKFFELPDPVATRAQVRGEWGVGADDYVIVCVGMIRPDKGQDHLIGALGLMKQQGLTPRLVIVGSATAEAVEYERALSTQAHALGVDGQISFTGYRDDVARMMIAGDLVVIPSLTEAQPRVAVQAFATARPVVASAVGGVPEIVVDGETGWLVPPADRPALAAAITKVMNDPAGAAAMAAGARALAENSMRFDHRMAETLATYQTAITRAKARLVPPFRGLP